MKILSFLLRLIGGLGIAYGVGMVLVWIVFWRGYKIESNSATFLFAVLFGGIILNLIGNRLKKKDGTQVKSFRLMK
jgi:hypothetical protein